MRAPSLRTRLAVAAGRGTAALSRRLGAGEGGVVGGRVALGLDPGVIGRLAAGRRTVLVTGTNGKTTTAHLLAAARPSPGPVAHNATGANMLDGVAGALIADPAAPTAVLEVDELHLPAAVARLDPDVVVLLNLSRDQLDRGSEVASVARVVRAALEEHPALVVADRDDPVVAALAAGLPRVVWVSTGARWSRDRTAWADGAPPAPEPDWFLQAQAAVGPAGRVRLSLQLPGAFNAGNALVALAAADALGVPAREAAAAMAEVRSVAGRYGAVLHDGRRVQLHLAKNPAGWQETLPLLADRPALALALNAREPDGRDTSWLWDVPLERLPRVPVVACGEAAADLGLRLTYAGIEHRTEPEPLAALAALPPGDVTLVANYTAFTDVLRRLQPAP